MRRPALLAALLVPWLGACVVTTYEGVSEAPRVPPPPPPPISSAGSADFDTDESTVQLGGPGAPEEGETIGASHVLIAYRGAKGAGPDITRNRTEARARAEEVLKKARAGQDFGALATQYSDEPGAAERGGWIGRFQFREMVEPFSEAAFELEVGEISEVVETDFGFHVILRNE